MTREEAIAFGKRVIDLGFKDETAEFCKIAISALSEELSEDGTLTVHVSDGSKVNRVLVMGENIFGGLYYPDSAENKRDLISRTEVINAIDEREDVNGNVNAEDIRTDICLIPSKSDKGEWIPVSERLPEDHQNILFSTKTDRVFEGRYFKDKTEQQWYSFRDECFAWNNVVTAWQPLPEPYKGESEE